MKVQCSLVAEQCTTLLFVSLCCETDGQVRLCPPYLVALWLVFVAQLNLIFDIVIDDVRIE